MPTVTLDDSRTASIEKPVSPYVNSLPHLDAWGQPPASYFNLQVVGQIIEGQLIEGIYVINTSACENRDLMDLHAEMTQWESIGIQDWINFENGLD